MPPEERRAAIIDAARPLMLEHGTDFTTRQVAEAAGIAEGTIFRVFPSIARLQWAVIEDLLDPTPLKKALESIPRDDPLESRVRDAITYTQRYVRDAHLLFGVTHKLRDSKRGEDCHRTRQAELADTSIAAIAYVLAPDASALTLPLPQAAAVLRAIAVSSEHPLLGIEHPTDPATLTTIFLKGARKDHA